jgi:hypothetical protein
MASRGWKLVDYAESTRQAMFEPQGATAPAGRLPWTVPPGYWRGVLEEWTAPRRLAITLALAVLLAALFIINARQSRFDPEEAAADANERWWTVTADRVNVRERPAGDAPIVAMFHKGQRVLVTRRNGGWAEVGQPARGFVTAEFLRAPHGQK